MKENWKPIEDCPGYEVSDRGQIRSVKVLWSDSRVTLRPDGKVVCRTVSQLVAKAFIPNPENLRYVMHLNGDQTDNRIENLRWCSKAEISAKHSRSKAKNKKI